MSNPASRGVDGITAEQLRAGRQAWWDAPFTRLLLEPIPADTRWLVDLGCGLGRAAHDVLPAFPELKYTGLDLDEGRLAAARDELAATPYGARAEFVQGDLLALPFDDASVDVAIVVMTLQHVAEPRAALQEVRRVLRSGGVAIAIEPDNLDQGVYFGGRRPAIEAALIEVWKRAREARLPRDLAIGPLVPSLFEAAGFEDVSFRAHTAQATHHESAAELVERLRKFARLVADASEAVDSAAAVEGVERSLRAFAAEVHADQREIGLMSTANFRVVGRKP